jgi:hypothetical protein
MTNLSFSISLDFIEYFLLDLSENEEFCSRFPSPDNHVTLPLLRKRCQNGYYNRTSNDELSRMSAAEVRDVQELTILSLFDDLCRMVSNSKEFNDCNRDFQPWRFADMVEMAILDLMRDLASIHSLTALAIKAENFFSQKQQQSELEEADF